jgi:hypothetical protein
LLAVFRFFPCISVDQTALAARRHANVAAAALANRAARIARAMLKQGMDYEPDYTDSSSI